MGVRTELGGGLEPLENGLRGQAVRERGAEFKRTNEKKIESTDTKTIERSADRKP